MSDQGWVLDPVTHVVGVQWGGVGFAVAASASYSWTTPEQSRPALEPPTVSGQYIGSLNILGGPLTITHPENPNLKLAEVSDPSSEEDSEEGTSEVCVSRLYRLWVMQRVVFPDGTLGPVELTFPREITQSFANQEQANAWADSFDDPLFRPIGHFAVSEGDCLATDVRPWKSYRASESGHLTINVSAIRRLMMGPDPEPGTPVPDVVFEVFIPGFQQTRTSGTAGVGVVISGPENAVEASMDDVKLPDVSVQDIPSQTLTVTIKPNNEIIVSR